MSQEYICPHCKNPIYDDDALLCHFCGESLGKRGSGMMGQMRNTKSKLWSIIIGAIVLILIWMLVF